MNKITRSFAMALMLLLMTAITATAGGWAVITLDELPGQIVAGQSFTIGFTVRQHGRTLRDDLVPLVRFDRSDAKDAIVATAKREGASGHYVASVTLPGDGQWNWKVDIEQFGMVTQDMSPLTVLAAAPGNAPVAVSVPEPAAAPATMPESASEPAAPPANAPSPATTTVAVAPATNTVPLAAGVAGVIVAIGALAFWLRTRARLALVVVAAAGLIGAIGFATAGTSVAQPVAVDQSASVVQPAAVDKNASVPAPDQVAVGRALFSDKGCAMCHAHPAVKTEYGPFWIGDEPPELTSGKLSAEYLKQWLTDPAKLKPETVMPNLQLSDNEIGALIAFLGAK
ncbi:MAG: c-type cytochrome [Chloroflexi bacterium]|nr:c-type cytochrome [Chloroflexota bacterium]